MTTWAQGCGDPGDFPAALRRFLVDSGLAGGRRGHGRPFGPHGEGPWGPRGGEGPWGPRGDGPRGGWGRGPWQRGPRAGRGNVRSAVLALLTEQPMHGYQMIQEIERRSGGTWKASPGSVYPTLQQLEDEGLVRAEEQDGRRIYRLTDQGEQFAAERAQEFAALWERVAPPEDESGLADVAFGVAAAFRHLMRTGSAAQIDQAKQLLVRTRAELYRILGDSDASGDSDDSGAEGTGGR